MLPRVMVCAPSGLDALFAAELKKYEPLGDKLAKNVAAQEQLLAAIYRDNQVRCRRQGLRAGAAAERGWSEVGLYRPRKPFPPQSLARAFLKAYLFWFSKTLPVLL